MGTTFVSPLSGHLDVALTNYIKGFQNNELHSDKIAPRLPVPLQSGKYWIWARENQDLLQQDLRAAGAAPQRIRRTLSNTGYFSDSHALSAEIVDEARYNTDAAIGDLTQDAAAAIMDKILLAKEQRLATMLTDTTQVTNNVTLAGANQWSNDASSPTVDVEKGKAKIRQAGVRPTWMLIGDDVYTALINHPAIVERFKYTIGGPVTEAQLAVVFGLPILVGSAVVVDKNGAVSFVWGKNAIIGYTKSAADENGVPSTGRYDLSACKSFVWTGAPGTIGGFGTIIERKMPQSSKADLASADFYYDQRITATETLYLIKNAVA